MLFVSKYKFKRAIQIQICCSLLPLNLSYPTNKNIKMNIKTQIHIQRPVVIHLLLLLVVVHLLLLFLLSKQLNSLLHLLQLLPHLLGQAVPYL